MFFIVREQQDRTYYYKAEYFTWKEGNYPSDSVQTDVNVKLSRHGKFSLAKVLQPCC